MKNVSYNFLMAKILVIIKKLLKNEKRSFKCCQNIIKMVQQFCRYIDSVLILLILFTYIVIKNIFCNYEYSCKLFPNIIFSFKFNRRRELICWRKLFERDLEIPGSWEPRSSTRTIDYRCRIKLANKPQDDFR